MDFYRKDMRMPNNKVLNIGVMHFTKCSLTSTMASARIARFILDVISKKKNTDCYLIDDKDSANSKNASEPFDILFVVNSPFGFCDWRDEAVEICNSAEYVLWVQNDYAIKPPSQFKSNGTQISQYLTTCEDGTDDSAQYIDWNKLTYNPDLVAFRSKKAHKIHGLFYYGAFREGREDAFKKYLDTVLYPPLVSTTPKTRQKFMDMNTQRNIKYYDAFTNLSQITMFQTSLYIEDKGSHGKMHSLANRFYEMLSAGLAICIDKESGPIFKRYGLKGYERFLVDSPWDVDKVVRTEWSKWASLQRADWAYDYLEELRSEFNQYLEDVWNLAT